MKMVGSIIIFGLLIIAGFIFAEISCLEAEAGDYYSPLYDFRLNQAAEGMGLLPEGTAMSGCKYGCMEMERLESPYSYSNVYGSAYPNPVACDFACCGSTCYGTACNVPTQTNTCDFACCGSTCYEYTCYQTYDNTCYGITCSLTCCDNLCEMTCSGTTCEYTCIGCTSGCTCHKRRIC